MPYPSYHSGRMKSPGLFARIVVLQTLPNGILVKGGPLKSDPSGPGKTQAYWFPKARFTVAQARKWLKDHNKKPILFEPAKKGETRESIKEYYKEPIIITENAISFTGDPQIMASLIRIPPREKMVDKIISHLNESLPEGNVCPIDDFWGAFNDVMPVYDLVLMPSKMNIRTSIQEAAIEEIMDSSAQIQARNAQKKDAITLSEFFLQPRMSIPSINGYKEGKCDTDSAIAFFKQVAVGKSLKTEIPPAIVQKFYTGISAQVHKDGNFVTIYASDGTNITERLPHIIEEIQQMKEHKFVMVGELEFWKNKERMSQESIAEYLCNDTTPEDKDAVLIIHTLLYENKVGDIHNCTEAERTKFLNRMDFPVKGHVILALTSFIDTIGEAERTLNYFASPHDSSGAVIKFSDSKYSLSGATIGMVRFSTWDADDLEEALRFALPHPSGKTRIAKKIVVKIPEHATYVESFCGAAGVFFAKKKESKEALNDLDPDIYFAMKFIQSISDESIKKTESMDWVSTRTKWMQFRDSAGSKNPEEKFYRLVYVQKYSYGKKGPKGGYDPNSEGQDRPPKNLRELKERLQGVEISNVDYKEVIKKYDSPNTFFYFDPPYPDLPVTDQLWKNGIDEDEFEKCLGAIKGKWMLSYMPTKRFKDYQRHAISLPAMMLKGQSGVMRTETLISNYKIQENTDHMEEAIATGKFVVQHQWSPKEKGVVIESWSLRIDTGEDKLMHMVMESDILASTDKTLETSFYFKDCQDKESMELGEKIEKIDAATWISIKDSGEVLLLENEPLQKEFEFKGSKLQSRWIATRENEDSDWWVLKRSTLPKPK